MRGVWLIAWRELRAYLLSPIAPNQSRPCALASITPCTARSMYDGSPPVRSTSCPVTSWTNCASRRWHGKALGGSEPKQQNRGTYPPLDDAKPVA